MKKKIDTHKKYRFTYIRTTLFTLFGCLLFTKGYTPFEKTGENFFHVLLNGQEVGTIGEKDRAEDLLIQARRAVASGSDELVFLETDLSVVGEEVLWGVTDKEEDVLANMETVLRDGVIESMHRSYTLKVNDYMVNLASLEEVRQLLQAAIDKYDSDGKFVVELVHDSSREFNVFATNVADSSEYVEQEEDNTRGGVEEFLYDRSTEEETTDDTGFWGYELGVLTMDFAEKVEIVEAYLPESQLTPLEEAVNRVVADQEVAKIYEVVKGDTLSEIAIKVDIPMDEIIAMNDSLEDENTMLHIGQQLIITVPEPELSVTRTERNHYEEIYDAEVEYIDVDSWYTTQTEVVQQPSSGFREVVADVVFMNEREVSREILEQVLVQEAVPMVVKRGTQIPPKYIRPIKGGKKTSGFGRRKAPTPGASTYHKGVDWATATGTTVRAASGGKVTKAGWGGSGGYVVYISHGNGRETRYKHLSKILVSAGQSVKQGDRIALSGSTGIVTGPHLHFEIWINGKPVNPLDYVKP